METPGFEAALDRLLEYAAQKPTAIMCAEAVPWRCHRNLVSDATEARRVQVFHILDAATTRHNLTSFASVRDSRVRYDDAGQSELFQP